MDYTHSNSNVVHAGSGKRMHSGAVSPTTRWSAQDANSLIWELMQVITAGTALDSTIQALPFDANNVDSYNAVLLSIKAIANAIANDITAEAAANIRLTTAPYLATVLQSLCDTNRLVLKNHYLTN